MKKFIWLSLLLFGGNSLALIAAPDAWVECKKGNEFPSIEIMCQSLTEETANVQVFVQAPQESEGVQRLPFVFYKIGKNEVKYKELKSPTGETIKEWTREIPYGSISLPNFTIEDSLLVSVYESDESEETTGRFLTEELDPEKIIDPINYSCINPLGTEGEQKVYSSNSLSIDIDLICENGRWVQDTDPANPYKIPQNCSIWNDGCNDCSVIDGVLDKCTAMACTAVIDDSRKPYCKEYYDICPILLPPAGCLEYSANEGESNSEGCPKYSCKKWDNSQIEIPKTCSSWFDGCNTCAAKDGVLSICTQKACAQEEPARCLKHEGIATLDPPTNLRAKTTPLSVNLSWEGETDEGFLYAIYRNDTLIGRRSEELTYLDEGLSPDTSYSYYITVERDAQSSDKSKTLTVKTGKEEPEEPPTPGVITKIPVNSSYETPDQVNILSVTESSGSPKSSGFSGMPFSTSVKLHERSIVFGSNIEGTYSSKNWSQSTRMTQTIPVVPGELYAWSFMMRSDEQYVPTMNVNTIFVGNNSTNHYMYTGNMKSGEWENKLIMFKVPDDGSVTGVRFQMFRLHNANPRGTLGNTYVDEIKLLKYPKNKTAGDIWFLSDQKTKKAFNSGNSEITVSTTGAWKLDGEPFVIKGAYPNREGDTASSLKNSFTKGYNTAYQNNISHREYEIVPDGMKIMGDFSQYINSLDVAGNWYKGPNDEKLYHRWDILESELERFIDSDKADDWIGTYIDIENVALEERQALERMVDLIRATTESKGTYQRPILLHSQSLGGAVRSMDLGDLIEFKNNPSEADFGTCDPYDDLQAHVGYAVKHHPEIDIPSSTAVFNTPHNGSYISNDIIDSVIHGAAGYAIWSDRPSWTWCNKTRGYENQPWWSQTEKIEETHALLDDLYPVMEVPVENEYEVGISPSGDDGYEGVSKTFRVVGDEVWVLFANLGSQSRDIDITTPHKIVNLMDIYSPRASVTSNEKNMNLKIQGYGSYVGKFQITD